MSASGRERAEGFPTRCAVAVPDAVALSSASERAEGFRICCAVAVAVAVAVTPSARSERAEGVPAFAVAVALTPSHPATSANDR